MPAAQEVLDIGKMGTFARIVRHNVDHHGKGIRATVATILGSVLLYHDPGTLQVSAGRKYKSFGTAEFKGRPLTFKYSHDQGAIQVREGSVRGKIIRSFDDRTRNSEIRQFFTNLVGGR